MRKEAINAQAIDEAMDRFQSFVSIGPAMRTSARRPIGAAKVRIFRRGVGAFDDFQRPASMVFERAPTRTGNSRVCSDASAALFLDPHSPTQPVSRRQMR
jgi:hypothetical protein